MTRWSLAAFLVIAVTAGGCQAPGQASRSAGDQLEGIVSRQLPGQISKLGGNALVRNVTCAETGIGNRFDCVARVDVLDWSRSGSGVQSIPITGYCDDENCSWKTDG